MNDEGELARIQRGDAHNQVNPSNAAKVHNCDEQGEYQMEKKPNKPLLDKIVYNIINNNVEKLEGIMSCWDIIFILFIFLNIVLVVYQYSDIKYDNSDEIYFKQVINNINLDVIEDIQVVFSNNNCEEKLGENYHNLFEYLWQGTKLSCLCNFDIHNKHFNGFYIDANKTKYFYIKTDSACSQDMINQGCSTIEPQPQIILNSWNNGANGLSYHLCAKRIENMNYQKNLHLCQQQDSKICIQGQNQFCINSEDQCPITEIGFIKNISDYEEKLQNGKYSIQKIQEDYYFYYSRSTDSLPIVDIKITEGQSICQNSELQNISPNRYDYPLMNKKRINCQITDKQYTNIDQISEKQVFYSNQQLFLEQTLPSLQFSQRISWSMMTKTYININQQCQENLLNQFINFVQYEQYTIQYWINFTLIGLQLVILALVLIAIMDILKFLGFKFSCYYKSQNGKDTIIIIMLQIILPLTIFLIEIIFFQLFYSYLDKQNQVLKVISEYNCFNDDFLKQSEFLNIQNVQHSAFWIFTLSIPISFLNLIVGILLIFDICSCIELPNHFSLRCIWELLVKVLLHTFTCFCFIICPKIWECVIEPLKNRGNVVYKYLTCCCKKDRRGDYGLQQNQQEQQPLQPQQPQQQFLPFEIENQQEQQ